jgi:predicted CXXCH cytochrome family protein
MGFSEVAAALPTLLRTRKRIWNHLRNEKVDLVVPIDFPGFNGISSHDTSTGRWNGVGQNPWPHTRFDDVMSNSCYNCHRNHNAPGKERLLSSNLEEQVCLACHNGNAGRNIQKELNKTSAHRVAFYNRSHDPAENILTAPMHVECADCHNPHWINKTSAAAPDLSGPLAGVSGMSITGSIRNRAQYQYEVCLKCHGQDKYRIKTIRRQFNTTNIRDAIMPTNTSYHPIAAPGKNSRVFSLNPPYTTSSRLHCTHCHNSDSSGKAGGSGPNGPHGSSNEFLLEQRYETSDHTLWSVSNYALCFKCHNPNLLFSESSRGFGQHKKHVQEKNISCAVCHDPHGSPQYPGLLNFETTTVFPNSEGKLEYRSVGESGYCYLSCHGKDHNPQQYLR